MKDTARNIEPIALDCGKPIERQSFKGTTFEMTKTNKGIVYNVYGGYAIFVEPNNHALYDTLDDIIVNREKHEKLEGKEKEDFEFSLMVISYILNTPMIAFSDINLTFGVAETVMKFIRDSFEKAAQTLQEETVEQDREFKDATMAMETIAEAIKEEQKQD